MSNEMTTLVGILLTILILFLVGIVSGGLILMAYYIRKSSDVHILPKKYTKYTLSPDDFSLYDDKQAEPSNRRKLRAALTEYGAKVRIVGQEIGPRLTTYLLSMNKGVKPDSLHGLENSLKMELGVPSITIHTPMKGTEHVGIEIPNTTSRIVGFEEVINYDAGELEIPLALGLDSVGVPKVIDLTKSPHLLIAGATGSGKSVCQHSVIMSCAYHHMPDQLRMVLIDPKKVEFHMYQHLPHLLTNIVKDSEDADRILHWLVEKMEKRNKILSRNGVRNIQAYNNIKKKRMTYIVVVVDELADLMMSTEKKSIEESLVKLAQMARAVGIHLVLSTQRPSVDVITGVLKANIPTRIAFQVSSAVDSRVVIDTKGAEDLLGHGDMLLSDITDINLSRIQGCYLSDKEIANAMKIIGIK